MSRRFLKDIKRFSETYRQKQKPTIVKPFKGYLSVQIFPEKLVAVINFPNEANSLFIRLSKNAQKRSQQIKKIQAFSGLSYEDIYVLANDESEMVFDGENKTTLTISCDDPELLQDLHKKFVEDYKSGEPSKTLQNLLGPSREFGPPPEKDENGIFTYTIRTPDKLIWPDTPATRRAENIGERFRFWVKDFPVKPTTNIQKFWYVNFENSTWLEGLALCHRLFQDVPDPFEGCRFPNLETLKKNVDIKVALFRLLEVPGSMDLVRVYLSEKRGNYNFNTALELLLEVCYEYVVAKLEDLFDIPNCQKLSQKSQRDLRRLQRKFLNQNCDTPEDDSYLEEVFSRTLYGSVLLALREKRYAPEYNVAWKNFIAAHKNSDSPSRGNWDNEGHLVISQERRKKVCLDLEWKSGKLFWKVI